jgi:dTDP-4-amino-4,6-dideoxygalactose transaminase
MNPIHISLSPNTEPDDIALARQLLLHPAQWRDRAPLDALTQELKQQFAQRTVFLTSSGRSALYHLLAALSLTKNDEVIIQAFTCIAVPASIQWAGATPVYADINPATFNLDPDAVAAKITPRTRAVIIQHTYGIPGPIKELQELCHKHNLVFIEDAAHALGASYNHAPIGSFGDAAIISFGRDKIISSVFGGGILVRHKEIAQQVSNRLETLPSPPNRWVAQQLAHPVLTNTLLPHYFSGPIGKSALVAAQKLKLVSKAVVSREKKSGKPPHVEYALAAPLAQLALHQLKKLERFTMHRRTVTQHYQKALTHTTLQLPTVGKVSKPAWLRFPVLHPNPQKLHQLARKKRIVLGDWYDTPLAPRDAKPEAFQYKTGMCPNAEQAAKQIVNLPTHPRLTPSDVERVTACVQSSV